MIILSDPDKQINDSRCLFQFYTFLLMKNNKKTGFERLFSKDEIKMKITGMFKIHLQKCIDTKCPCRNIDKKSEIEDDFQSESSSTMPFLLLLIRVYEASVLVDKLSRTDNLNLFEKIKLFILKRRIQIKIKEYFIQEKTQDFDILRVISYHENLDEFKTNILRQINNHVAFWSYVDKDEISIEIMIEQGKWIFNQDLILEKQFKNLENLSKNKLDAPLLYYALCLLIFNNSLIKSEQILRLCKAKFAFKSNTIDESNEFTSQTPF